MSVFYIVGPTAVGKSYIADEAFRRNLKIIHVNIDCEVKRLDPVMYANAGSRWPDFWKATLNIFNRWETCKDCAEKIVLLDVGAGSLQTENALPYFKLNASRTIYLKRDPQITYEQARGRNKPPWNTNPFKVFLTVEFSENRKSIYSIAGIVLELTNTERDIQEFMRLIN